MADDLLLKRMETMKLDIEALLQQLYNAEEEVDEFSFRVRLQAYIVLTEHIDNLFMQIRKEVSQPDQNQGPGDTT